MLLYDKTKMPTGTDKFEETIVNDAHKAFSGAATKSTACAIAGATVTALGLFALISGVNAYEYADLGTKIVGSMSEGIVSLTGLITTGFFGYHAVRNTNAAGQLKDQKITNEGIADYAAHATDAQLSGKGLHR